MSKQTGWLWQLALIALAATLLVAGCGGKPAASQPKGAESKPTATAQPRPTTAQPTAAPASAAETRFDNALEGVVRLAPVHLVSQYTIKEGDELTSDLRVEIDVDTKGNQHLVLIDKKEDSKVELYVIDKTLYVGAEQGGQTLFIAAGEAGDSLVGALSIYGGAALALLDDLEGARKVGSETVNGYQADKYEFKMELARLGVAGLAAQAQGAISDYQGLAWIEPKTKALVRSRVDMTWKAANEQVATVFHQEFDATKGSVQEIKPPENIVKPGS